MKILVTGGAGFLGSVLVPMLLDRGDEVVVVDNFQHGVPSLSAVCAMPNLRIVNSDARGEAIGWAKSSDALVLLAAVVGAPACDNDQLAAISVNLGAIKNICRLAKGKIIIYPNTNSGYGAGGKTACTEKSPVKPLSLYAKTKAQAEEYVLNSTCGISLRFATLFGASPRMRLDLLVNDFVYRAVHDRAITLFEGHFRRNYLHVRDAARCIVQMLDHAKRRAGEVYNVGDSRANLTKRELCLAIKKHIPTLDVHTAKIGTDPDKRDYLVSNAKIEATGWRPDYSLDSGIIELIQCYRQPFHTRANRNV